MWVTKKQLKTLSKKTLSLTITPCQDRLRTDDLWWKYMHSRFYKCRPFGSKSSRKRVWCSWSSLSKHPHVPNKSTNDSLSVNVQCQQCEPAYLMFAMYILSLFLCLSRQTAISNRLQLSNHILMTDFCKKWYVTFTSFWAPYRFLIITLSYLAILLAGHTFNHILNVLLTLKPQISLHSMFVTEMLCLFV